MVRASTLLAVALALAAVARAADESEFYRIVTLPVPAGLKLEVSGIATLPDGRVAVAIRRGEIWLVENAWGDPPESVHYRRFASGLHEPLGLLFHDNALWTAQRAELTRIRDTDDDGAADEYITAASGWGVSGNYHEYAYGPVVDPDGSMWMTLNSTLGKTVVKDTAWRGWVIASRGGGAFEPVAAGLRSPCGIGTNLEGDVFFTDQQGNWVPTCSLQHVQRGAFYGHPASLVDCARPGSPFTSPGKIPSGMPIADAARRVPSFRLPAVWFPYRKMGQGSTDVLCDTTGGKFGPFAGQLFVGDFTLSLISRVALEKVRGEYQGACFPFRSGFQSAVLRMAWGPDGSMLVGETNRGWNSLGTTSYGLERLVWSGKTPFEVKTMSARADGFELEFTGTVDPTTASRPASFRMESYTYTYHATYGSPEIDRRELLISSATVSDDGRRVRLVIEGLREGYVHELSLPGVRAASGGSLHHPRAYYTLNRLPEPAPR